MPRKLDLPTPEDDAIQRADIVPAPEVVVHRAGAQAGPWAAQPTGSRC